MVDVLTKQQRSFNMSQIRAKDTKPEIIIRKSIHSLGYRYRLHVRKLPGCPDMVFPSVKKVIFIHGCYWHRHNCKYGRVMPSTRKAFWQKKLNSNKERDNKNTSALKKLGWKILVVWACQLKNREKIINKIINFLED